jgi:6-hydroxynicotinate 3-monooxygenase
LKHHDLEIAIVGGGLGGLAVACLLQQAGFKVTVYEQAKSFARIGAGIHLGPNLMKVLQRIGIAERVRAMGVRLEAWVSRKYDTGEVLLNYKLGAEAEARYGAPYMMVHRGDFHACLLEAVTPQSIRYGKRLIDLEQSGGGVRLGFEDGTMAEADILIGADGVRSRVREVLVGLDAMKYTGSVAHRALFPASFVQDLPLLDYTKWWADDRIILPYFITRERDVIFFVAASSQKTWPHETASVPGDLDELREQFSDFHPEVRRLLAVCPSVTTWAQFDTEEPLPLWSAGRIVLLGDACHAMTPYMGQGAAMAIEDAAMLSRCLQLYPHDPRTAFQLYEAKRKGRSAAITAESRKNTWLKENADPDWVFGYDIFAEPLPTELSLH